MAGTYVKTGDNICAALALESSPEENAIVIL
jgi:hypothetical protein